MTAPVLSDGTADFTPSGEKRGSVKTTYHSALENSDIQTDSSGAISASVQFDAFGNVLSGSGSWKGQFGYAGKFGYQQDPDTGLKLLGHRYYDSDTGRFLTRDPAKDGRNWYTYCRNNPVSFQDRYGLDRGGMSDVGKWWQTPIDPDDLVVPPSPFDSNLRKDIERASRMKLSDLLKIYSDGGDWDFAAQDGGDFEPYGNFHFGVIMASLGFSLTDTLHVAGLAEWKSRFGKVEKEWGSPFEGFPFGDDPIDLFWVIMGWYYYHYVIKPKQKKEDQKYPKIFGNAEDRKLRNPYLWPGRR